MMHQSSSLRELSNTMGESPHPSEDSWTIFLEELKQSQQYPLSALLSMPGKDGKASKMEKLDTLMRWYGTLSPKARENILTRIVDSFTPPTSLGTPSLD